MCSSMPSMQLMTLSTIAPISTCERSVLPFCHHPDKNRIHAVNNCNVALHLWQYNNWHDWVLQAMGNICIHQLTSMTMDLPFYTRGADSLLWDLLWGRKEEWYHDLIAETRKTGYTPTLITVKMWSRGLPNMLGFQRPSNYMFKSSVNCCWMHHSKDRIRSGVPGTTLSCEHYL